MAEKEQPKSNYRHIVRIANVDIPGDKAIRISLTKIKGIGMNFADAICVAAKLNHRKKTGELTDSEIDQLNEVVKEPHLHGIPEWMFNRKKDYETGDDMHLLTGTLNYTQDNDLKRLKKTKTLRGMRHQRKLPVRGQRTRSNFRRSKGKVVGVKKKGPAPKKK